MPELGELVTLAPHDLSLDGGSIARLEGMVVFLDRGLPGQRLRARITGLKSAFARAEVLDILDLAGHDAPLYCPHQGACGGCAWPGLDYAEELAWKERRVRESLRRLGGLGAEADSLGRPVIPSPRTLGYRNKLEFAFSPGEDGGPVLLGLKRRGTHRILPVDDCRLARSSVAEILAFTRHWADAHGLSAWNGRTGFLRRLVVRQPDYAPHGKALCQAELIVHATAKAPAVDLARAFGPALQKAVPGVHSFVLSQRLQQSEVAYGERVLGARGGAHMRERIGHLLLQAPPTAFLQVNSAAAALMHTEIRRLAEAFLRPDSLIWDLYCGVGGIGLFLADRVLRLHGFERSKEAAACALRNAARNDLRNCVFTAGEVTRQAEQSARGGERPDLVITDPPRAGISPELSALLLKLRARALISVSCDPAAQARDIARLAAGYRVRHVQAFDFFPHSPHVESLILLERREDKP